MTIRRTVLFSSLLALAGCAAKPLLPGGAGIVVSKEPAPEGCRHLGGVRGAQGNFWTAEFTSDRDLVSGARNELRNAALDLRANYVKIETESLSENTGEDSLGGLYSVVIIGNAYDCDQQELISK